MVNFIRLSKRFPVELSSSHTPMSDYRSVLYKSYNTTFYSDNPSKPDAFVETYDLDYRDVLPPRKDAEILDLGCGTGHFLYYLGWAGYTRAQGIDRSPEQAAIAIGFTPSTSQIGQEPVLLQNIVLTGTDASGAPVSRAATAAHNAALPPPTTTTSKSFSVARV